MSSSPFLITCGMTDYSKRVWGYECNKASWFIVGLSINFKGAIRITLLGRSLHFGRIVKTVKASNIAQILAQLKEKKDEEVQGSK